MFSLFSKLLFFFSLKTVLILSVVSILLAILFYNKRKRTYEEFWKHIMAIPGPKVYPIVGSYIDILETSEQVFAKDRILSQKYFPIYKELTFNFATVFLLSPQDAELLLKNNIHNTKSIVYSLLEAWLGTGLLTSGGTKWHSRRKIATPAFHFNILQEFTGILNRETELLVEELKKLSHQPYINVVKPLTAFTLFSIGETALGVNLRDEPKCEDYKKAIEYYGSGFTIIGTNPWLLIPIISRFNSVSKKLNEAVKVLHDFSTNVISKKKLFLNKDGNVNLNEKKKLALLDLMLKARQDGADIDDEGVREELDTFIFAGHDTTSGALSFHLMLLANNPSIQEQLYEEIIAVIGPTDNPDHTNLGELKVMERSIKESLRLYPSAPFIGRVAGEDIKTKSGYIIPKGTNVSISIFDMHRAEQIWENPEKFDPDRFLPENCAKRHPFAFIPFSAGSRNCIGQKFAMLEMKIALCGILRNFRLEAYDRPEHIKLKSDIVLKPIEKVRVTFVPRA